MFWPAIISWSHRLLLGVPSRAHPLPHLLPRARQLRRGFPLPRARHLRGGFPVSRAWQLRGFPLFARRRLFGVGGPPISGTDAGAVQAVARADGALLEAEGGHEAVQLGHQKLFEAHGGGLGHHQLQLRVFPALPRALAPVRPCAKKNKKDIDKIGKKFQI
jgi:hypothetical protein